MIELVSPAGDWPSLRSAIKSGCNSIYFGLKALNMRAGAKNFDIGELNKIVDCCHENKIKCYLALNTIIYENEIDDIKKILKKAKQAGVDAVIAWDFSIIEEANKLKIPVHLSTQASVSNFEAVKFFSKYVSRIVLARELSLEQIKKIKEKIKKHKINVEIECFVHGAMCVSESGRCFTSQFLFGKSANRGQCIQPCRREYKVTDLETGQELALKNNHVMSPKDLCTLNFLDQLIDAGVDVLKIEGRNRAPEYVSVATKCYHEALDAISKNRFDEKLKQKLLKQLSTVYNRKFSSGFYLGLPTNNDWTDLYGSGAAETKKYIGKVRNFYQKIGVAELLIEADKIKIGNEIFIIGNKTGVLRKKISSMQINHKNVKQAEKGKRCAVVVDEKVRKNDKVFLITR
ncbi:U32 family peptidase [Candidatus Woesearchaeota archaeon]|nr:U32 family peptidase [Candidatus Woesearchaeota archaeon]